MPTDANWTWTILMRDGRSFHLHESVDVFELLDRFQDAGNHESDIEAIIRH